MNYNYQPFYAMQQPQMSQPSDDRIWIQSELSAEAYLVAPNSTVHLWDSTKPYIYVKKTDSTGRPIPMEILEYKPREIVNDKKDYEDVLSDLQRRIEALEKGVSNDDKKSNSDDTRIPEI